jgi:hypothetical protein
MRLGDILTRIIGSRKGRIKAGGRRDRADRGRGKYKEEVRGR